MKKIAVIFLLFLYLISSSGINVAIHYCGGKISSISFGETKLDKCACGNKEMKQDCCKDKNVYSNALDDQSITKTVELTVLNFFSIQAILPIGFKFNYQYFPTFTSDDYFHHPPNRLKLLLYILHQVFRI